MSSEDVRLDGATASAGDPPPDEHLVTLLRKTLAENNRLREALEEIQKRASLASADEWDIGAIARHALHPETQP